MTKQCLKECAKALEKRVAELEAEIATLKARPAVVENHYYTQPTYLPPISSFTSPVSFERRFG